MIKDTIILASGGTGGHIFPAEALAEELINDGFEVILVTDKRYKRNKNTPEKLKVICIKSSPLNGNVFKKAVAVIKILLGTFSAIRIIQKNKAKAIVGFGAYPSFPTLVAAILLNKPTIIHEQNSVFGKVNRLFAKYVTKIALSFENTRGLSDKIRHKAIITGNPIRKAFLQEIEKGNKFDKSDKINLLIVGGSLGAKILSDVVTKAVINLPENIKDKLFIYQQCRKEDLESVKQLYKENNIEHEVDSFFLDIANKMQNSNLIISRAGASSIFEILYLKKPSILIPYKYATDHHQSYNAQFLSEKNAAICIEEKDLEVKTLRKQLIKLLSTDETIEKINQNIKEIKTLDSTKKMADIVKDSIRK